MVNVNFGDIVDKFNGMGYNLLPEKTYIRMQDARENVMKGIKYFTNSEPVWNDEYEDVCNWLTDNNGRGMLVIGTCGTGKTLICGKIIPVLINCLCNLIVYPYNSQDMNQRLDDIKSKHLIYIDDIGIENISNQYGNKRMAFPEIVDDAEKNSKILIGTSNLSIEELQEKYGIRTIDRLRAIVDVVVFTGTSLRK